MKREFFKKITFVMMCLTILAVFTTSCGRDDDDELVKHTLKFEIAGNYTGNLKASVIFAGKDSADVESEDVSKLPWSKEVEVKGAYEMSITANSWDKPGKKGEKITIKMYADGKEVKSKTLTANADGDIVSTGIISYSGGN